MRLLHYLRPAILQALLTGLLMGLPWHPAGGLHAAEPRPQRELPTRQLPVREARPRPPAKAEVPEPIVIDGALRSSMGYPRVFAQILFNGQPVVGRPAHDVLQRARALSGDYMDLNLAASAGRHAWWTAVLDTGADGHTVNQDTAARFGLRNYGDMVAVVSGTDGEGLKGMSWIYPLKLAGSDGRLNDLPSTPFTLVQEDARFGLELKPYQPQRRVSPDGANLIGMAAIRNFVIEIDNENATPAMLAEPLDMTSARAFEESLQGITAGPRVRLLPPAFRPTNAVVRLPLRYTDGPNLTTRATPTSTTPLLPGVRASHLGKQTLGNLLFDTGSSITLISRRLAFQLGLVTDGGPLYSEPEFKDSFVGINDREIKADGYVIDSIEILGLDGQIVQWRNVPVLVHDFASRQPDGSLAYYDGIIGNNLFMASTNGEMDDRGLKVNPPSFPKYWIHGPMGEVWVPRPAAKPAR
jgi:hypothetical protein